MTKSNKPFCHICYGSKVTNFPVFHELSRVASDCRPWPSGGQLIYCLECQSLQKLTNDEWGSDCESIYATYDLYHQSPNKTEQPIFNASTGTSQLRSEAVLSYLLTETDETKSGRALDFGCGNGAMLKTMSKNLNGWEIFGYDPSEANFTAINNASNQFTCFNEISEIKGKFDLISMIHVLEHIKDPIPLLKNILLHLKPDGKLLIAIPNYLTNPFDIVISDHCSHFTKKNLYYIFNCCGLKITNISTHHINKEIVLVCEKSNTHEPMNLSGHDKTKEINFIHSYLKWLIDVKDKAQKLRSSTNNFGIFGTSIAANWLLGQLGNSIDFFVDEDSERVDQLYRGKPVYLPKDAPKNSSVFIPLDIEIAKKLQSRIQVDSVTFEITPEKTVSDTPESITS